MNNGGDQYALLLYAIDDAVAVPNRWRIDLPSISGTMRPGSEGIENGFVRFGDL